MESQKDSWIDTAIDMWKSIKAFLEENPEIFLKLKEFPQALFTFQKELWSKAAQDGWYIDASTPFRVTQAIEDGQETLDDFMIDYLEKSWTEFTDTIVKSYPYRKHILEVAFRLHQNQEYIASVPLFISQADGICKDVLGQFLFTKYKERKREIERLIEKSDGDMTEILLEMLVSKTPFNVEISDSSSEISPNRHGILHGSREHLDYGTRLNSFKSFSLLLFIVGCFEHIK